LPSVEKLTLDQPVNVRTVDLGAPPLRSTSYLRLDSTVFFQSGNRCPVPALRLLIVDNLIPTVIVLSSSLVASVTGFDFMDSLRQHMLSLPTSESPVLVAADTSSSVDSVGTSVAAGEPNFSDGEFLPPPVGTPGPAVPVAQAILKFSQSPGVSDSVSTPTPTAPPTITVSVGTVNTTPSPLREVPFHTYPNVSARRASAKQRAARVTFTSSFSAANSAPVVNHWLPARPNPMPREPPDPIQLRSLPASARHRTRRRRKWSVASIMCASCVSSPGALAN
jgi:hypothetical protein